MYIQISKNKSHPGWVVDGLMPRAMYTNRGRAGQRQALSNDAPYHGLLTCCAAGGWDSPSLLAGSVAWWRGAGGVGRRQRVQVCPRDLSRLAARSRRAAAVGGGLVAWKGRVGIILGIIWVGFGGLVTIGDFPV